jgi:putative redox protein
MLWGVVRGELAEPSYRVEVSNDVASLIADTVLEKGGSGSGFRPHDLLEAALAACLNISVRICADAHGIALSGVRRIVTWDRSSPDAVAFVYSVELGGSLSDEERSTLLAAADASSVRATLSKEISFRAADR